MGKIALDLVAEKFGGTLADTDDIGPGLVQPAGEFALVVGK